MPRNTKTTPEAMKAVSAGKTNARGRTAKTNPHETDSPRSTEPQTPQDMRREVNRPMSAGVTKRGDRRQMTPDPGMRANGQNRGIRAGQAKALTGKAIGGRRVSTERGRGNSR
jgi:hypothetical protein